MTLGCLGALLVSAAGATAAPGDGTSGLDAVLRSAVDRGRVPAVVALVATDRGIVYEGAFGMDKTAIVAIASMTKPITSAAVMQLVDAGKVKLDEPAGTYVPELAAVQVLDGETLRPPKTPVTVRQLLTHTSGFAYEFLNKPLADHVAKGGVPTLLGPGDGFLKAPLAFDPGARWEYGISTDWLGRLVEKVSGQSLDAYMKQHLFEPLGMRDTSFEVPSEKQERVVATHRRGGDGRLQAQPRPPRVPVTFYSGGGGLHSTAGDYLTFARALMAGGQLGKVRILSGESVAQMGRNQIGDLSLRVLPSLMPQLVRTAPVPGSPDKFGLGFALNTKPLPNGRGADTMSWSGVYNTFFWVDREKKVCAVVMMQMLPFLEEGPEQLIQDFDRAVYDWRK
jgi:methyl acetate hydrolase